MRHRSSRRKGTHRYGENPYRGRPPSGLWLMKSSEQLPPKRSVPATSQVVNILSRRLLRQEPSHLGSRVLSREVGAAPSSPATWSGGTDRRPRRNRCCTSSPSLP